ncbi:MAG: valine--tRNA ligase [Rickettsiales bacterium]
MLPLAHQYDQAAVEKKWQAHWLTSGVYAWNPATPRADSYVIDTPPPTVSGTLHMGHVFSYTQADFIARFQRMTGKNVFYPMGFDDNGLPTERLVEKTKKIRATDMSREDFIKVCLGVSEEARAEFRTLFQSIALSVDWAQEYHTISDDSRRLSQLSFLDLVKKDQVYRKLQPMLWDPVDQTAIAQAEVEDKELPSHFTDIAFTCADTNEELIIGTTRPELLPACVALFYHPFDKRYQHLAGKQATVPLFGFTVPILTDETVEPDKGTGLMMCCTFGDEKDIEKWRKYDLPMRMVINKFGKVDLSLALPEGNYPEGYVFPGNLREILQGKKVSNTDPKHLGARETTLAFLKDAGLIRKQTAITHAVKCAERSGAALELIPTSQWFVKVTDKKDALKAKAAESSWNPDWMRLRMEQWIDGLNWDWCISRQRYFGVPFPVWYSLREGEIGKAIYATVDQLPVNPLVDLPAGYSKEEVTPDMDVMDTWATSSISPQLSAHGIHAEDAADKDRYAKLYPADLRPQAHEIIRTWAFYTLVKSYLHSNCIAWKNLMISGWCLAEDKSKMSKSKGNVITPVALIEERGTDAVRYWAGTSRLGMDTAFSPDLLKIGKKLVGKLWNATAFAAIHLSKLETAPTTAATDKAITETLDRWILSRLGETIAKATEAFKSYEYADALDATNQFFWADFCDNYLELIKKRVYNEDGSASKEAQQSAVRTLYYVLDGILKLYAPFTPHVTEELYSHIFADSYATKGSLHTQGQWPAASDYTNDENALDNGRYVKEILEHIRRTKSEASKSVRWPVARAYLPKPAVYLHPVFEMNIHSLESLTYDLKGAGNIAVLEWGAESVTIDLAEEADAANLFSSPHL